MQKIRVNIRGVVNLRLEDLNAFQEDIKILTDERYASLKEEILEDGFSFSPHVFLDSDGKAWILDGHQRRTCLERMKGEGFEVPIIPCMEVEAESLEHARRLVLAGTSQYGTFQPKKIVDFVKKTGLEGDGLVRRFVLPTVNFPRLIKVSGYIRGEGEDNESEPPAVAKTKPGQVYELGRHLLMCGSSLDPAAIETLLGKELADITFTSPPYNAGNQAMISTRGDGTRKVRKFYEGFSDDLPPSEYVKFAEDVLRTCLSRSSKFVFWNVNYNANSRSEFIAQIVPFLDRLVETICWKKSTSMPVPWGLNRRWEPIYVFRCDDGPSHVYRGGEESNVWEVSNHNTSPDKHKAAFPVALVEKALSMVDGCESVFDPFGGTGSTMIAAEKVNKRCFMMELVPGYCDAIVDRWEKFSGKKAKLRT